MGSASQVTVQVPTPLHDYCGGRSSPAPRRLGLHSKWMLQNLLDRLKPPTLTKTRVRMAYGVAVATDGLQFVLGPFGWAFADEILDAGATLSIGILIGFHPLLLPTFILEFVPLADMLPTWTGCVALVVRLRRRQPAPSMSAPLPPSNGPIIDV